MIGARLKKARLAKGLSQAQLAEQVGFSQPFLSEVERGDSDPSVENMVKCAVELDVSFEWLATGRGEMLLLGIVQEPRSAYHAALPSPTDKPLSTDQLIASAGDAFAVLLDAMSRISNNFRAYEAIEKALAQADSVRRDPIRDRLLARGFLILGQRARRRPGEAGSVKSSTSGNDAYPLDSKLSQTGPHPTQLVSAETPRTPSRKLRLKHGTGHPAGKASKRSRKGAPRPPAQGKDR